MYTKTKAYRYEIFASQMASMSGNVFHVGYIPGKEYKDFIDELVEDSLIETEIHSESSDHILTLSICTGNGYDSRMTDRPCRVYRRTYHRSGKTILKLLSG